MDTDCVNASKMDLDLSEFRDILLRNTYKGDAYKIESIVAGVFKLLSDKGYINNDGTNEPQCTQILRKITFCLILNSDIIIRNKMVDSDEIASMIWVTPLISKCILISLLTELHLFEFYCEAITYSNPLLSIELLEIAAQNINYTTPEQRIKYVNLLFSSVYAMVARFIEYPLEDAMQNDIFDRACEKVRELLECFEETPIKNKDDDKWDTNKLNEILGERIASMLQLLVNCFNIFEKKCKAIDYDIYLTTYCEYTKKLVRSNNGDIVLKYLSKLNELLLHSAKLCIMQIGIDLFCSWFDYKESEDSDKPLQRAFGEQAYNLHQMIKNLPSLEREIGNMLDAISKELPELKKNIKDSDRIEILRKSNDKYNNNQHDWLASLIRRDYFFQDKECLECAIEYIYILKKEWDFRFIFVKAKWLLLDKRNKHPNSLKTLFFASLSRFTREEQVKLITCVFFYREIGNLFELPDYDAQMTEFLITVKDIDDKTLFVLYKFFMQNPEKFYKVITKRIVSVDTNWIILQLVKKLNIFNELKIHKLGTVLSNMSLMLKAVCEINPGLLETQAECDRYISLASNFMGFEILKKVDILLYVVPKLQYNLTTKNLKGLLIQLQVMDKMSLIHPNFDVYFGPLLIVLSRVLESARWDLKSFSEIAVDVIETTVRLQKTIMDGFIKSKKPDDKEFKWILSKLSNFTRMTVYYYQGLWPDTPFKGFFDMPVETADVQRNLIYLLPRSSTTEFHEICKYFFDRVTEFSAVLNIFHALTLLNSVADNMMENSSACIKYCFSNLLYFFQNQMISNNSTIDRSALLESVIQLTPSLPLHQRKSFHCFIEAYVDNAGHEQNWF